MDWIYVAALLGAPVAGVAGVIAVRTRGEAWLAVGAFTVSMLLPGVYAGVDILLGDLGGAGVH